MLGQAGRSISSKEATTVDRRATPKRVGPSQASRWSGQQVVLDEQALKLLTPLSAFVLGRNAHHHQPGATLCCDELAMAGGRWGWRRWLWRNGARGDVGQENWMPRKNATLPHLRPHVPLQSALHNKPEDLPYANADFIPSAGEHWLWPRTFNLATGDSRIYLATSDTLASTYTPSSHNISTTFAPVPLNHGRFLSGCTFGCRVGYQGLVRKVVELSSSITVDSGISSLERLHMSARV
jgi:hypothetical protein